MRYAKGIGGVLSAVAVLLTVWGGIVRTGAKAAGAPSIRWVETSSVGLELVGMKKEIKVDDRTAKKLFAKGPSCLREGWWEEGRGRIENAPDAKTIPEGVKKDWIKAKNATPHASVLRFTKKELVVVVLEPKGVYLWHQYHECLGCFRVPRNEEIDTIFGVCLLEKTYGAEYKGLRQGSSVEEVKKKLGEPDEIITTQALGFEHLCYHKDNVTITVNFGQIERFQFGASKDTETKTTRPPR